MPKCIPGGRPSIKGPVQLAQPWPVRASQRTACVALRLFTIAACAARSVIEALHNENEALRGRVLVSPLPEPQRVPALLVTAGRICADYVLRTAPAVTAMRARRRCCLRCRKQCARVRFWRWPGECTGGGSLARGGRRGADAELLLLRGALSRADAGMHIAPMLVCISRRCRYAYRADAGMRMARRTARSTTVTRRTEVLCYICSRANLCHRAH